MSNQPRKKAKLKVGQVVYCCLANCYMRVVEAGDGFVLLKDDRSIRTIELRGPQIIPGHVRPLTKKERGE